MGFWTTVQYIASTYAWPILTAMQFLYMPTCIFFLYKIGKKLEGKSSV